MQLAPKSSSDFQATGSAVERLAQLSKRTNADEESILSELSRSPGPHGRVVGVHSSGSDNDVNDSAIEMCESVVLSTELYEVADFSGGIAANLACTQLIRWLN